MSDHFWSKVDTTSDGCWEWQAGRMWQGYGHYYLSGKTYRAHRFAWTLENGPIPAGMCVMHLCDNPPCVRPSHLRLGSIRDNNKDMSNKGRYGYGRRKLTQAQVDEIRSRVAAGEKQRLLATDYGVCQQTISDVCRMERTWA
jgi:hypothetical protein